MKRLFTLILAILLSSIAAQAQLTANAGADIAWCEYDTSGTLADTPSLGAPLTAGGGLAPYAYSWKIQNGNESTYLDNSAAEHPKFKAKPAQDFIYVFLKVTDAAGNRAYDTVLVRIQKVIWQLGTTATYKSPADTVSVNEWQGFSNFKPYHAFAWYPSLYLIDSAVEYPKTYSPVSQDYRVIYTDRMGCRFKAGVTHIVVAPAGIPGINNRSAPIVAVWNNESITITLPSVAPATFTLVDHNGRSLLAQKLGTLKSSIALPSGLPAGIYYYQILDSRQKFAGNIVVY
jgi:hypothetical protein